MLTHICNNYVSSKVHAHLVKALAQVEPTLRQWVYVPVRRRSDVGKNSISAEGVELTYSECQGPVLRYFPLLKIVITFLSFIVNARHRAPLRQGRVLAHTLWSDGCVAYLHKIFTGVPYSVVVRNSDLNWFLPRLPHYRWLFAKIISSAESVIFISPAYSQRFAKKYPNLMIAARSVFVIPNGINDYWSKNSIRDSAPRSNSVIFVGRFDKNKNLRSVIESVEMAIRDIPDLRLILVGGSKKELVDCTGIDYFPEWIDIIEHIDDAEKIRDFYRSSNVLLMPSFSETFGLVYIEAFSQGCPFIYTKNEGMDGFFPDCKFSISVEPKNIIEISKAIIHLIKISPHGIEPIIIQQYLRRFDWNEIAKKYCELLDLKSK